MANCEKCGADLGGVEYGVPVTTNSGVRYERGEACVKWEDGSPVLYGHTCRDCARPVDPIADCAGWLREVGYHDLAKRVEAGTMTVRDATIAAYGR